MFEGPPDDAAKLAFVLSAGYMECPASASDSTHYVEDAAGTPVLKSIPSSPGKDYEWSWSSYSWELSSNALEALKERVKAEIDNIRDMHKSTGVTYAGNRFDSGPTSVMNMLEAVSSVNAGATIPGNFTWRTQDNRDIPFSSVDILGLAAARATKNFACYQRAWALKAEVDAFIHASDYPQLAALDISVGWPE